MRFFSPLLGKSAKITQATYPCTIDGSPATIDGSAATIQGAFEEINNDIYDVVPDPYSFRLKIDTSLAGSASDTFILPTVYAGFNATVNWGDGEDEVVSGTPGNISHTYTSPGIYIVYVTENSIGGFPRIYFNNAGDKAKVLEVSQWGTNRWGNFSGAFYGCSNMIVTAVDVPDTSSVTNFLRAFRGSGLTSLNMTGWDIENVTTLRETFYLCPSIASLNVTGLNPVKVLDLTNFVRDCASLTALDISSWNTPALIDMRYMCSGCTLLTSFIVTGINTALVTIIDGLVYNCTSLATLDVSGFNTVKVKTMINTFRNIPADVDLSAWNILALTDASNILRDSGFSTTNYDLLLPAWDGQPHNNTVTFHGGTAKYSAGAPTTARGNLVGDFWTILDGGPV